MDNWKEAVSEIVADVIVSANRGCWPRTYREWRTVAGRLGMNLATVKRGRKGERFGGELVEDDILVAHILDRSKLNRIIAHELAEGILRRELAPPFRYRTPPGENEPRHQVARIVESRTEPNSPLSFLETDERRE